MRRGPRAGVDAWRPGRVSWCSDACSFFSLLNLEQVLRGLDQAAVLRRVEHFHRVMPAAQAQTFHRSRYVAELAMVTANLGDLDATLAHELTPRISSTVLPRLAAISSGARVLASALMVARTTLMGLREP